MSENKKRPFQARVFTASLKPAWTDEATQEFLENNKGIFEAYVVRHDKDIDEQGEVVEAHTHVLIIYETPRQISTVANVLGGIGANFVVVVQSKQNMLRYLTHKNDSKKYQYSDDDVKTNSTPYAEVVKGFGLSDRDIVEAVQRGDEFSLLGSVSMTKITMAQRMVGNRALANANIQISHLRNSNQELLIQISKMLGHIETIDNNFSAMVHALTTTGDKLSESVIKFSDKISTELKLARLKIGKK
jgi:hypothetical protein